ncbi:hypothetical protein H6761_02925 [Candidatus Nomurabacteria bacterium]|nr:hypothetical protein [Candidatus Nomurabacteria bacterium]
MKKQMTSLSGIPIVVDTSEELCSEFGFKPHDRVSYTLLNAKGEVAGVTETFGKPQLCVVLDCDDFVHCFDKQYSDQFIALVE